MTYIFNCLRAPHAVTNHDIQNENKTAATGCNVSPFTSKCFMTESRRTKKKLRALLLRRCTIIIRNLLPSPGGALTVTSRFCMYTSIARCPGRDVTRRRKRNTENATAWIRLNEFENERNEHAARSSDDASAETCARDNFVHAKWHANLSAFRVSIYGNNYSNNKAGDSVVDNDAESRQRFFMKKKIYFIFCQLLFSLEF